MDNDSKLYLYNYDNRAHHKQMENKLAAFKRDNVYVDQINIDKNLYELLVHTYNLYRRSAILQGEHRMCLELINQY